MEKLVVSSRTVGLRLGALLALVVLVCPLIALPAAAQNVIGEYVYEEYGTPDHYYPHARLDKSFRPGVGLEKPAAQLTWSDVIVFPGATYIAPHFSLLNLPPGDVLVVRSEDGNQHWSYTDQGRVGLGVSKEGFFATHIKGDTVVLELFSANPAAAFDKAQRPDPWGVQIDYFGRGYSNDEIEAYWIAGHGEAMQLPPPEFMNAKSICGTDDSREAKCYQSSEASAYNEARAVARLFKNGNVHCTGWLIGCEGHIMTNEHCIGSQSELNNIDFEFMAEGSSCSQDCRSGGACSGTIEASGGTLVSVDANLDYALVDPPGTGNLSNTYGYLQARSSGATVGERIYIAQHPAGWGKRIAMESSHASDGGFAKVSSTTEGRCGGSGFDVGYFADTQGGSSGSPVLGYNDDLVVALHHCGGCDNLGVPIEAVLADLGSNTPACATGGGGGGGGGPTVLSNGVPVTGLSGSTGNEQFFTLAVPAGSSNLSFDMSGGTGDADLYVKFGSAPTTSSYDCRPYVGGNSESCPIDPAQTGTYHVMIRAYSTYSGVSLEGSYTGGGGGSLSKGVPVTGLGGSTGNEQTFTLSVPAGASNLTFDISGGTGDADLYVRFGSAPTTSQYDCRPYKTGNAENCSFAAPSTGTYHVMIRAYSTYSGVTLVADYDIGGGDSGQTWSGLSGATGNEQSFTQVITTSSKLTVTTSGSSGDADLYVRLGAAPTTSTYDCRGYTSGSNESCVIDPASSGTYYIMVRAYSTYSGLTLTTTPE